MNKKAFIISFFTVFVQYYDYHIYGFLAAKIASYFFSDQGIIEKLLKTYLIMFVAMIAKPIGAIILGNIGDRSGRATSFKYSLIATLIASLILFVSPSYGKIGLISTILLLISRMIICAAVSSGADGVRIFVYEYISDRRKCIGISITTIFTQAGTLFASLTAYFVTLDIFPSYFWKYSFLLGAVMSLIMILIIQKFALQEKEIDNHKTKNEDFIDIPLSKVILSNIKIFIASIILAGAIGSNNQFFIIFFGTYNFEILGTIDKSSMKIYVSIAIILYMLTCIPAAMLADKYNKYNVILFGIIISIVTALIQCIYLLYGKLSIECYLIGIFALPFISMPSAVLLKEAIRTEIRYRIFSLSHAIGSIIISSPTAYISTLIYDKTDLQWSPLCYFIITIVAILFATKILMNNIKNNEN